MSRYDKRPVVRISDDVTLCTRGWLAIVEQLLHPGLVASNAIREYPSMN